MTEIPNDIREKAKAVHAQFADSRVTMNLGDIIALALFAEHESATSAERERCARIADDYDQAPGDDTPMGPLMAAQVAIAQTIAAEIRAGA